MTYSPSRTPATISVAGIVPAAHTVLEALGDGSDWGPRWALPVIPWAALLVVWMSLGSPLGPGAGLYLGRP